ncbi:hypothetical protein Pcinc_042783 [Petrolisthes cinctipes]|uniref:DH domain-containing protein n=1 Tax=Petrolisthes cinctipes TaxID=88211 RepID=A0AAE1BH88_PETCI|nr:hypothetical protein Pcinc_042783 [Petrolisthes cinctipes]
MNEPIDKLSLSSLTQEGGGQGRRSSWGGQEDPPASEVSTDEPLATRRSLVSIFGSLGKAGKHAERRKPMTCGEAPHRKVTNSGKSQFYVDLPDDTPPSTSPAPATLPSLPALYISQPGHLTTSTTPHDGCKEQQESVEGDVGGRESPTTSSPRRVLVIPEAAREALAYQERARRLAQESYTDTTDNTTMGQAISTVHSSVEGTVHIGGAGVEVCVAQRYGSVLAELIQRKHPHSHTTLPPPPSIFSHILSSQATHPSASQTQHSLAQTRPTAVQTHPTPVHTQHSPTQSQQDNLTQPQHTLIQTQPCNLNQTSPSLNQTLQTLPQNLQSLPQTRETHPQTLQTHPQTRQTLPQTRQTLQNLPQTRQTLPQTRQSLPQTRPSISPKPKLYNSLQGVPIHQETVVSNPKTEDDMQQSNKMLLCCTDDLHNQDTTQSCDGGVVVVTEINTDSHSSGSEEGECSGKEDEVVDDDDDGDSGGDDSGVDKVDGECLGESVDVSSTIIIQREGEGEESMTLCDPTNTTSEPANSAHTNTTSANNNNNSSSNSSSSMMLGVTSDINNSASDITPGASPELTSQEKRDRKVFLIAHEIMTSEKVFVDVLRLLNIDFRRFVMEGGMSDERVDDPHPALPTKDLDRILNYLPQLQNLNEEILSDLEKSIEDWESRKKISDVIVRKGPFLKLYSDYIREFQSQCDHLDHCCNHYPAFTRVLKQFEASERCTKLGVKHYMLKPVQRIPQYRLLLEQYLRTLPQDSPDYLDTQDALVVVANVASHANTTLKQGEDEGEHYMERELWHDEGKLWGDEGELWQDKGELQEDKGELQEDEGEL